MPDPSNAQIAELFDELADLYQLDGAVVHRVLAYRNAAKAVRDAPTSVAAMTRAGTVTSLPGIGRTLEEKLVALVETGTIPALERLRARFPAGLLEMTRLPGLGPRRARRLFDELGVSSLEALAEAAREHRLRDVRGFGEKFEASVLAALEAGLAEPRGPAGGRVLLSRALAIGETLVQALRAHPAATSVELAGSARRMADTVKDLDVVAAARDTTALLAAFEQLEVIESAASGGPNAARGRTHTGMAVDLRVVEPAQFGNLLQHFTGSAAHNVRLRERAVRRGLHVSEYGILDDATGETLRCATEEEVYAALGLPWLAPELREDRGELDLAQAPPLVEVGDLRGDLHMHTVASDGRSTAEEMARAALARGYEYVAITDHSASHGFGNDVSPDELVRQIERVRELDERLDGIRVLVGTECNIGLDGSLDYDDDLLAQLDWVIASVHSQLSMSAERMTARVVTACEHPLCDAIGHLTGRKIGSRAPSALDLDAVLDAAARSGTMIEINGAPDRRDLDDVNARAAAAAGVRILIDSDAHGAETLGNVRWAVATARRAWLGPADVANTLPWEEFAPLRKRARAPA
ncbi:MAG TPA: DNA polymerase/3'-5' exonuclease PolX [Solirubrobacteraceae bacterium]|nr:DNA polymerase/3'-5' exonuclease PolX [Solirubrobacteraceae bacterium]